MNDVIVALSLIAVINAAYIFINNRRVFRLEQAHDKDRERIYCIAGILRRCVSRSRTVDSITEELMNLNQIQREIEQEAE